MPLMTAHDETAAWRHDIAITRIMRAVSGGQTLTGRGGAAPARPARRRARRPAAARALLRHRIGAGAHDGREKRNGVV